MRVKPSKTGILENVEHCGGEPEQADIMSLMSDVIHQVLHGHPFTIHGGL